LKIIKKILQKKILVVGLEPGHPDAKDATGGNAEIQRRLQL
jgi:hypothetical protein